MIFRFRYRKPFGAVDGYVDASDVVQAVKVAETWCLQQQGYRFIPGSCEPMVCADESILAMATATPVSTPTPKPPTQPNGEPIDSTAGLAGAGSRNAKSGRIGA